MHNREVSNSTREFLRGYDVESLTKCLPGSLDSWSNLEARSGGHQHREEAGYYREESSTTESRKPKRSSGSLVEDYKSVESHAGNPTPAELLHRFVRKTSLYHSLTPPGAGIGEQRGGRSRQPPDEEEEEWRRIAHPLQRSVPRASHYSAGYQPPVNKSAPSERHLDDRGGGGRSGEFNEARLHSVKSYTQPVFSHTLKVDQLLHTQPLHTPPLLLNGSEAAKRSSYGGVGGGGGSGCGGSGSGGWRNPKHLLPGGGSTKLSSAASAASPPQCAGAGGEGHSCSSGCIHILPEKQNVVEELKTWEMEKYRQSASDALSNHSDARAVVIEIVKMESDAVGTYKVLNQRHKVRIFANVLLERIIGGGCTPYLSGIFTGWLAIERDTRPQAGPTPAPLTAKGEYKVSTLSRKLQSIFKHSEAFSDASLHNLAQLYGILITQSLIPLSSLQYAAGNTQHDHHAKLAPNAELLVQLIRKKIDDSAWGGSSHCEEASTPPHGETQQSSLVSHTEENRPPTMNDRCEVPSQERRKNTCLLPTPPCDAPQQSNCGRICRVICRPVSFVVWNQAMPYE